MNNQATLEKLSQMKLYGMLAAFKASLDSRLSQELQPDELLAHLVESEWLDREKRKTDRYVRSAHFRYQASVEEIDYTTQRGLDKNQLLRLYECSFIDKRENILITGPTGAGKSYLASALVCLGLSGLPDGLQSPLLQYCQTLQLHDHVQGR